MNTNRRGIRVAVAMLMAGLLLGEVQAQMVPARAQTLPVFRVERLRFDVDEKTPLKELLPTPPESVAPGGPIVDDLSRVPEVHFQKPIVINVMKEDQLAVHARKNKLQTAYQMAKMNFLNQQKRDRFLETLIAQRPDLAGLPFAMGDACRVKESDLPGFRKEVALVRTTFNNLSFTLPDPPTRPVTGPERFWKEYDEQTRRINGREAIDAATTREPPDFSGFAVAGLMQVIGAESRDFQAGLIARMTKFPKSADKNVTEALAQLAVFSTDSGVRWLAIEALLSRDLGPADPILLKGLRYPWPDVARSAMEAVVQLKRDNLKPELAKILREPDPRAPVVRETAGKKEIVVREVVRINHHRNCLLCHPPAGTAEETVMKHARTPARLPWKEVDKGVHMVSYESRGFPGSPTESGASLDGMRAKVRRSLPACRSRASRSIRRNTMCHLCQKYLSELMLHIFARIFR